MNSVVTLKNNQSQKPTNYHSHKTLFQRRLGTFKSKKRNTETGLYYYGARYLDPRTSRWLTVDPDGRLPKDQATEDAVKNIGETQFRKLPEATQEYLLKHGWILTTDNNDRIEKNNEIKEFADINNPHWSVSSAVDPRTVTKEIPLTETEKDLNALRDYLRNNGKRDVPNNLQPKKDNIKYEESRIFTLRVRDKASGEVFHMRRQYIDINNDGHIDGWKDPQR